MPAATVSYPHPKFGKLHFSVSYTYTGQEHGCHSQSVFNMYAIFSVADQLATLSDLEKRQWLNSLLQDFFENIEVWDRIRTTLYDYIYNREFMGYGCFLIMSDRVTKITVERQKNHPESEMYNVYNMPIICTSGFAQYLATVKKWAVMASPIGLNPNYAPTIRPHLCQVYVATPPSCNRYVLKGTEFYANFDKLGTPEEAFKTYQNSWLSRGQYKSPEDFLRGTDSWYLPPKELLTSSAV